MSSAGEVILSPFTVTRPSTIMRSASRRLATPARAIILAMRSPEARAGVSGASSSGVSGVSSSGASVASASAP